MSQNKEAEGAISKIRQDRKILFIALAAGIVASVLAFFYIRQKVQSFGQTMQVLIATSSFPRGGEFAKDNLGIALVPEAFVVPNMVPPADMYSIIGAKAAINMSEGQQISYDMVEVEAVGESMGKNLDSETKERGVTIQVNEFSGLAGYIRPNDRVDVIGTFVRPPRKEGDQPRVETKTIMQCVTVLAVGTERKEEAGRVYESVTLKVSPEEASLLAFAESAGKLRLLLRNPDDLSIDPETPQIDMSNIFKIEKQQTARRQSRIKVHGARGKEF